MFDECVLFFSSFVCPEYVSKKNINNLLNKFYVTI